MSETSKLLEQYGQMIDRMERQLAAAERLYEVLRHQDASFNMDSGERLKLLEALADYANAKGE